MSLPVQFYECKDKNIQDLRPTMSETQLGVRPQIHTELLALREMISLYERNL
jgi:hypothetical protein